MSYVRAVQGAAGMRERVAVSRTDRRHRDSVARSDARLLLGWLVAFVAAFVLLLAADGLYRLTGPHPQISQLVRDVKHDARWLIPGEKSRRSDRDPPRATHYADCADDSGHDAQRAVTTRENPQRPV